MSLYSNPAYSTQPGSTEPNGGSSCSWSHGHNGPPLPIKIGAFVLVFLICKPLALIGLAYFLLRGRSTGRSRHAFAPAWRPTGGSTTGNSAFDEKRAEELKRIDDEAKAFAEFTEQQRRARDQEAFDRFKAERGDKPEA